jgi:hypothetical protein
MPGIEKYIPRRIQKDVAPDAVFPGSGDRMFLPGDLVDALNCRYKNGRVLSVKGNVEKVNNNLPVNSSTKVIGVFPNDRDNTIIYVVYDRLRNHRIIEYSIDNETFTTLLAGDIFNSGGGLFAVPAEYLTGGVIDNALIMNDRKHAPFYIDLVRARAGEYVAPYNKYLLSLAVRPPLDAPMLSKATDATIPINNVAGNTWQAAFRYVFLDNRKSTFSPLSDCLYIRKNANPSDNADNAIDVTGEIPAELFPILKRIEVAIRKGNNGDYYIFNEVIISGPVVSQFTTRFTNLENQTIVPIVERDQLANEIPAVTGALEIIDNRVFLPLDITGFDVNTSTFGLSLSLESYTYASTHAASPHQYIGDVLDRFVKLGGIYNVGIVFSDDYGRTSYVQKKVRISIPDQEPAAGANEIIKQKIKWTLTGTPPSGFTKYCIVISKNQNQAAYVQCKAVIHWYFRDMQADQVGVPDVDNIFHENGYNWNGRMFTHTPFQGKVVLLQIPYNLPIKPDNTYFVKFKVADLPYRIFRVEGIVSDFLVLNMTAEEKTYLRTANPSLVFEVEIFLQKETTDDIFYETGPWMSIRSIGPANQLRVFNTKDGIIDGDTYIVDVIPPNDAFTTDDPNGRLYSDMNALVANGSTPVDPPQRAFLASALPLRSWRGESPSGIFNSNITPIVSAVSVDPPGEASSVEVLYFGEIKVAQSLDYTKSAWSIGRVRITNQDSKKVDLFSTFGFSEPYVQGTFVNGLNVFRAENQYPLSVERGRVRCLKRAGQVLVAIHERETSTLYIGEGFIRQGNDFILAKTESVVGDDRKLIGGFGTINPESVIAINDQLYWWDAYRGAVVRYTNAGNWPVSVYGMEDYFYKKAQVLFPYRNSIEIITAYDDQEKELLITFPEVKEGETVIHAAETWAFNIKDNEWKTRYPFTPEHMVNLGLNLFSFKQGQLWQHNKNNVYNNFYGVQYPRYWVFACNPYPGRNKRYLNIHIEGDIATDPTDEDFNPIELSTKEGQESFIPANEFTLDEGKWNAPVLRDVNTPGIVDPQTPLLSGDEMVSTYLLVKVVNDRTDEAACSHVNVVYKEEKFSL